MAKDKKKTEAPTETVAAAPAEALPELPSSPAPTDELPTFDLEADEPKLKGLVWRVLEEKLVAVNGHHTTVAVGQIFDANVCGPELILNLRDVQKVKMEPIA